MGQCIEGKGVEATAVPLTPSQTEIELRTWVSIRFGFLKECQQITSGEQIRVHQPQNGLHTELDFRLHEKGGHPLGKMSSSGKTSLSPAKGNPIVRVIELCGIIGDRPRFPL
jgi:hypothetical protein